MFPDGKAAAQGSFGGYNYTERICQEYGQHPRRYWVRDPIAGSDWRNDGGWAIVQEHGPYILIGWSVNANGAWVRDHYTGVYGRSLVADANGAPQLYIRNVGGWYAPDDAWGLYAKTGPGPGDGNYLRVRVSFNDPYNRYHRHVSGGAYIRWVYMAWCR